MLKWTLKIVGAAALLQFFVLYAEALDGVSVEAALLLSPQARHGSALAVDEAHASLWSELMLEWLLEIGMG